MQQLFAWETVHQQEEQDIDLILKNLENIDLVIQENAPKWPLEKINKVDLSILRYSLWELIYQKKTPPKVIIDEAIELAKEFGTESSSSFVNGVLGSAVKKLNLLEFNEPKDQGPSKDHQAEI